MEAPDDATALARSIAERLPVDWDSAESSGDAAFRETARELRVISAIAAFHRQADTDKPLATWGSFRLLERVGHGAYADVYRAIDPRLDRVVALKLLRQADTSPDPAGTLVIEEARLLARLTHPSVVTIHGADRIDDRVGLWMEFVDGRTLEQVLKEDGPLASRELAVLCVDVCRALDAVHEAGLLHRDVKAQNVMRDVNGRHVLMDFGAGRMAGPAEAADFTGTPLYLAPELLNGAASSRQSDIYAVGVLLFHVASGRYPVEGTSVEALRAAHEAHARTDFASLRPDCPAALLALVERALSERPSDRFASAREMGDLAATMVKDDAPGATRRVLAWSLAGVLALAAAFGSASWFVRSGSIATDAGLTTRLRWDNVTDIGGTASADGRLLSFTDWSSEGSVAVRDLTSEQTRLLVDARTADGEAGRSAISPDGRLVAYAWLPSDSSKQELRVIDTAGGTPRTLPLPETAQFVEPHAWSPDGRWIVAFVGGPTADFLVQLMSPDGTTTRTVANLQKRWAAAIRVSPDGQWVVIHDGAQLFTARTDGSSSEPVPLSVAPAITLLAWMPDGRVLLTRDRDDATEVYALPMLEGRPAGEPVQVEAMSGIARTLRVEMGVGRGLAGLGVTSSGALIYGRTMVDADAVTVTVDPVSGQIGPERVGQPVAAFGMWDVGGGVRYSPDGTRRLFTPSPQSVAIVEADNRTRTIVPHLVHIRRVEWAADDRSLLISGNRDGKERGVFRVDPETGSASPLFVGIPPIPFCLSADGRTLYFAGDKSRNNIIARDLQSRAERSLHRVKPWVSQLKLSRDGRLAVMTRSSIDVVDVAAGTVRPLAARPAGGWFSGGDWAPDGQWFFATASYGDVDERAELWRIPADGGAPVKYPLAAANTGGWMRPDGGEFAMMRTERRQQVWRIENFLPPMEARVQ